VADGLLYRQQGKGTFVAPVLSDWGNALLQSPGVFDEVRTG
jgi:GntR family transcriptional regulator